MAKVRDIKGQMDKVDRIVKQALRKAGLSPTEDSGGSQRTHASMLLSPEELSELESVQITRDANRWARENR